LSIYEDFMAKTSPPASSQMGNSVYDSFMAEKSSSGTGNSVYDNFMSQTGQPAPEPEEKGFISTALDYLDKPASAVAGAVEYIAGQSDQDNILSAAWEGAKKNTDYGKVLQRAGVDPESLGGKVANIGGKILLDPLWMIKPVTVGAKIAAGSKAIGLTDKLSDASRAIRESDIGRAADNLLDKEVSGLSVRRWFTEESPIQKELDDLERAGIQSAEKIREGSQKIEELKKIDPELGTYVTRAQEGKLDELPADDLYKSMAGTGEDIAYPAPKPFKGKPSELTFEEFRTKYHPNDQMLGNLDPETAYTQYLQEALQKGEKIPQQAIYDFMRLRENALTAKNGKDFMLRGEFEKAKFPYVQLTGDEAGLLQGVGRESLSNKNLEKIVEPYNAALKAKMKQLKPEVIGEEKYKDLWEKNVSEITDKPFMWSQKHIPNRYWELRDAALAELRKNPAFVAAEKRAELAQSIFDKQGLNDQIKKVSKGLISKPEREPYQTMTQGYKGMGEGFIPKDTISDVKKSQVYAEVAQKYGQQNADKLRETVDFINDINMGGSRGLLDRNLISPETFEKFTDRYIRREYSKYVTPAEHLKMLQESGQITEAAAFERNMENIARRTGGKYGLDLKAISQRKDLPEEVQKQLGRLMDATHPFAKGGKITADLINRYDFLESVMKNHASDKAEIGYKLIEGKKFGPLDGKYLPREIANEVNRVVPQMTDAAGWWRKAVGYWKLGKTVLSPATFMRNNISNLALLNIAGVPTYHIPQYMMKAANELHSPGKFTALANKSGTFLHNTMTEAELRGFLEKGVGEGLLTKGVNAAKGITEKAADVYQGSEKLGKMAAFMWAVEKKGMNPADAAKFADEALFNYSKVPPIIDTLRKNGLIPFATFPYKATKATAKALYENPARVAGYYKPVRELQDPDEKTVLPDYLNPETLLPVGKGTRTVNGKEQPVNNYIDLQNILPFQSTENLGISPAFTVASALYQNKNPLTNREIARKGMTTSEKAAEYGKYAWQQFSPATPIIPGTYGYDKLINQGVFGEPDYRGRQYGLGEAVAHTILGVKNTPINTIEAGQSRLRDLQKEVQAIKYEIRSVQQDARLQDNDKKERIAEYKRRMQEVAKEMKTVGAATQRLKKEGR
jgi:hypothetical protein